MQTFPQPSLTATQRAHEFAKWAILNAVYGAGEVITESGLAAEIGVSRTPVREALMRLEVEGLVTLHPKRGAVVSSVSVAEAEDVLEARELVENFTAARSFANRARFRDELGEVHEQMRHRARERDTAGFTACDRAFHETIVDGAGNAVLSSMYRTLRERQTLFTSVVMRGRVDRMKAAITEHQGIIDALAGEDQAVFLRTVESHLRWSIELARQSL